METWEKHIAFEEWKPQGVKDLEPAGYEVVRSLSHKSIIAGPGAGKTELLAQRACYLLQTGICPPPKRILAISFKKDAAKNLKDRVIERCQPDYALRFDSLTFDAFSKHLLDRFYKALPNNWRVTEDYEILSVPKFFLITKEGNFAYTPTSFDSKDLELTLRKLLQN